MPSLFVAATSSPSTSASPSSASSGGDEEYGLPIIDPDPLYSSDDDPEIDEMRRGARSSTHRLTPLKTKAEVDKGHEQMYVYVCEIPSQATSEIMEAFKTVTAKDLPMPHLKRVAKKQHQPDVLTSHSPPADDRLWLLLCSVDALPLQDTTLLLSGTSVFGESDATILTIPVPRHPPLSAKHATQLSRRFWPTVYTSTNPFGPHPSLVVKNTNKMDKNGNATKWMKLAHDVARAASRSGRGAPIGTVVVERLKDGTEHVVCVAEDARYATSIQHEPEGNPAAHSVLRAIAMIADKRLALATNSSILHQPAQGLPAFQGSMSSLEASHFTPADSLSANGYLCLDLLIFTTHEPCLMCSMALVHSRVGGIVFRRAMKETGGMLAERGTRRQCGHDKGRRGGLLKGTGGAMNGNADGEGSKYGLFWREDLNWRFLAWQWDSTASGMYDFDKSAKVPYDLHA